MDQQEYQQKYERVLTDGTKRLGKISDYNDFGTASNELRYKLFEIEQSADQNNNPLLFTKRVMDLKLKLSQLEVKMGKRVLVTD